MRFQAFANRCLATIPEPSRIVDKLVCFHTVNQLLTCRWASEFQALRRFPLRARNAGAGR